MRLTWAWDKPKCACGEMACKVATIDVVNWSVDVRNLKDLFFGDPRNAGQIECLAFKRRVGNTAPHLVDARYCCWIRGLQNCADRSMQPGNTIDGACGQVSYQSNQSNQLHPINQSNQIKKSNPITQSTPINPIQPNPTHPISQPIQAIQTIHNHSIHSNRISPIRSAYQVTSHDQ